MSKISYSRFTIVAQSPIRGGRRLRKMHTGTSGRMPINLGPLSPRTKRVANCFSRGGRGRIWAWGWLPLYHNLNYPPFGYRMGESEHIHAGLSEARVIVICCGRCYLHCSREIYVPIPFSAIWLLWHTGRDQIRFWLMHSMLYCGRAFASPHSKHNQLDGLYFAAKLPALLWLSQGSARRIRTPVEWDEGLEFTPFQYLPWESQRRIRTDVSGNRNFARGEGRI